MTSENKSKDRSISIGESADGSTVITGDGNTVNQGPVYQTTNVFEAGSAGQVMSTQDRGLKVTPPYFFPEGFVGEIFVGRALELEKLHEIFQAGDRVEIAVVGMGGIGKTTIARRYVRQNQADYPGGIWWLPVAQLVTKILEYAGRSIGLDELPTEWSNEQIVQHYLAQWDALLPDRKLLVLDNVGAYKQVKSYLPQQGAFQVLMTTRVRMQPPVSQLSLEVLDLPASMALLRELLGEDSRLEAEATISVDLCEWLGYLPLGLELVGRYLSETSRPLADVLSQLKQRALASSAISTVADEMDYEDNVQSAIELSWQTLDEPAQIVALLLSLFALAPIEADWVITSLPDWDEGDVFDCLDRQLVKRSLVNRENNRYELHGLVREFLHVKLARPDWVAQTLTLRQGFAKAMTVVSQTIPQTMTLNDREMVVRAVPHLEEVVDQWPTVLEGFDQSVCCIGIARFYQSLSRWVDAEQFYQQALDIRTSELGGRHPDTARSLNNLAEFYRFQGRYAEAEPLLCEALDIRRIELGDRHPDTASNLNNLALLYRSQGNYVEAKTLLHEALNIRKTELGSHHLSTASSLNNLAALYFAQGEYSEAERFYLEALDIWKSELGDNHPSTASSLNNLAALYRSQGRYAEAEPLLREALGIRTAQFGDRHPSTASSLNNLAEIYRSQGQYGEAETLLCQALDIWKSELGDRHPSTASSLNNLATLYSAQGNYVEAEPLLHEALDIWRSEFGEQHPDTAMSLLNLATLYHQTQQHKTAFSLIKKAQKIYVETLGTEHPTTQTATKWLHVIQKAFNAST